MTASTTKRSGFLVTQAKRFLHDTSGNVIMMFAFAAIPMVIAIGAGIDNARINREHASFLSAVDSAAVALAGDDRTATDGSGNIDTSNLAALKELAKNYVKANYSPEKAGGADIDVNVTVNNSSINLKASIEFPTTIMKLVGYDSVKLDAESQVEKAMRPVELVLVMDTTGSMGNYNRMTDAKAAARSLLDLVYGGSRSAKPRNEYLRVALVPFAAAVRVSNANGGPDWVDKTGLNPLSRINFTGDATLHNYNAWSRIRVNGSTVAWNGCVETRARGSAANDTDYNVNDAAPNVGVPASLFPAYFAPDMPSIGSHSTYGDSTLTPLPMRYFRSYSYNNSYISDPSQVGNSSPVPTTGETSGMSLTQRRDGSVAGFKLRMTNAAKYTNANITTGGTVEAGVGPWYNCAATPIVPLTHNRENVEVGIDLMTARGNTNIPEGLAWGMRVISPGAPYTQVTGSGSIPGEAISDYDLPGNYVGANAGKKKWTKIMLLMTDGDNELSPGGEETKVRDGYNSTQETAMLPIVRGVGNQGYSSYGYRQNATATNRFGTSTLIDNSGTVNDYQMFTGDPMQQLDADMATVCSKIKNNNVLLYVTSFGTTISDTTKARLQNCATTPKNAGEKYYTHADGGPQLSTFFRGVGRDVLNKMVYISK